MRYFAMIDGERRGPFELAELADAGVKPDTYVWCRGMADWEKAEDVADICRHFRQTIFDRMHPTRQVPSKPVESNDYEATDEDPYESVPLRYRRIVREAGEDPNAFPKEEQEDYNRPPSPTLFPSLFAMLFCFPITGFVAMYYSFMSRRTWTDSQRSETKADKPLYTDDERRDLRRRSHEYDRQAKMWLGITLCLGLILYAFIGHRFG